MCYIRFKINILQFIVNLSPLVKASSAVYFNGLCLRPCISFLWGGPFTGWWHASAFKSHCDSVLMVYVSFSFPSTYGEFVPLASDTPAAIHTWLQIWSFVYVLQFTTAFSSLSSILWCHLPILCCPCLISCTV